MIRKLIIIITGDPNTICYITLCSLQGAVHQKDPRAGKPGQGSERETESCPWESVRKHAPDENVEGFWAPDGMQAAPGRGWRWQREQRSWRSGYGGKTGLWWKWWRRQPCALEWTVKSGSHSNIKCWLSISVIWFLVICENIPKFTWKVIIKDI